MSTTKKEIRISGKSNEEVKECIFKWVNQNGFKINELESKGRILNLRAPFSLLGVFIKPHRGTIVASQIDLSGCIVFEIKLKQENCDTLLHGEFYACGAEIFLGLKSDLKPNAGMLGKYARESGYALMIDLLKYVENC